jgi:serine/threonine-protein kinase
MRRFYRTGAIASDDRTFFRTSTAAMGRRMQPANAQFLAEAFAFLGDREEALHYVELGVAAGLPDRTWIERCPLLAPLRDHPRFRELASQVIERAEATLAVISEGFA